MFEPTPLYPANFHKPGPFLLFGSYSGQISPRIKSFDSSTKVIPSLHIISLGVSDRQWNELPAKFKITWRHSNHPRRPRGSQSGREKRRNESFQVRTKEPLGTDSHRTISKSSSRCRLLIGHKKCFVLLCPIGEHISWVLFVCSYTTAIARLVGVMHQRNARSQETFSLI